MTPRGDRLFRGFLVVAFAAMAVELVLLARQNRELKTTVARLERDATSPIESPLPELSIGTSVPPIELATLDGEPARIRYDETDQDTFLLIFSPGCPACRNNMDNWKALERAHEGNARLYYVSAAPAESTRRYADEQGLGAPVLLAGADSFPGYNVTHIPTTIVVGPGGVVKRVWVGQLPQEALPEGASG